VTAGLVDRVARRLALDPEATARAQAAGVPARRLRGAYVDSTDAGRAELPKLLWLHPRTPLCRARPRPAYVAFVEATEQAALDNLETAAPDDDDDDGGGADGAGGGATRRRYMRGALEISPAWLAQYGPTRCERGAQPQPLRTAAKQAGKAGKAGKADGAPALCTVTARFGEAGWQLPPAVVRAGWEAGVGDGNE
jgi:hypothetical protein